MVGLWMRRRKGILSMKVEVIRLVCLKLMITTMNSGLCVYIQ